MISLSLQHVADSLSATLYGEDRVFSGCSTDSRQIQEGQLFVALHGPNFDGHDYLDAAAQGGAVAAMIDTDHRTEMATLKVSNTRIALGDLAHVWRQRFTIPVVGITGSNGKTTVKEMLSSILTCGGRVLATRGNLNNDIGVPQTLFGLDKIHDFAVIEMGANHSGEIARLCDIANPVVAVVTQCAPAHLEGFGTVENVALAKGEIYQSLDSKGTAIINMDDRYASLWKQMAGNCQTTGFGLDKVADVTASAIRAGAQSSQFNLHLFDECMSIDLPLPGRHNIMNALAAAACAQALGISLDRVHKGLESISTVPGRLQFKPGRNGSSLIDDTYNANPGSFSAALDVLIQTHARHWLVLGDMGELGKESVLLHRQAGELARSKGVERLYTTGDYSVEAARAFGAGAGHFTDHESLINTITNELDKDVTLLIKGSRSARMETVVQALIARE